MKFYAVIVMNPIDDSVDGNFGEFILPPAESKDDAMRMAVSKLRSEGVTDVVVADDWGITPIHDYFYYTIQVVSEDLETDSLR